MTPDVSNGLPVLPHPPADAAPAWAKSAVSGPWRWVSRGLLLGAVVDLSVGAPMLIAPAWTLATMRLTPATPETYVRLNGVFLIVLALYYALSSRNPERYIGNVGLAILGRLAGCAFYFVGAAAFGEPHVFYGLAALNLALATIHTITLARAACPCV